MDGCEGSLCILWGRSGISDASSYVVIQMLNLDLRNHHSLILLFAFTHAGAFLRESWDGARASGKVFLGHVFGFGDKGYTVPHTCT